MSDAEREAQGIHALPDSLGKALEYMEKSELVKEALGEHLFNHFLYIKKQEWKKYTRQITNWEIEELLSVL